MDPENDSRVTFGKGEHCQAVELNGVPDGEIRRFTRFGYDVWTYDNGRISLVGPLREVQATIRRQTDREDYAGA